MLHWAENGWMEFSVSTVLVMEDEVRSKEYFFR